MLKGAYLASIPKTGRSQVLAISILGGKFLTNNAHNPLIPNDS